MGMGSPNSKDEGGRKTARLSSDGDGGRPSFGFADTGSSQKVLSFDESGERARVDLIEDHYAGEKKTDKAGAQPQEGTSVQTQVFRSEQADGSVVTTTVRTTRTTTRSDEGDYVTATEVLTTTETESRDGAKSTAVATETSTETVSGQVATFSDGETGDDVQTQVFRSVEDDGSVVTKTVRTTRRTVVTNGVATTSVEVQTTTETEATDGAKSTSVSTETHTKMGGSSSSISETEEKAQAALEDDVESEHGGRRSFMFGKKRKYHKQWHPHFVSYLDRQEKRAEALYDGSAGVCACVLR